MVQTRPELPAPANGTPGPRPWRRRATDPKLALGLVGAGAMGAQHARVIRGSPSARLAAVVDADLDRARRLAGGGASGTDLDALGGCEAAVVATPSETHAEIAVALLEAGVPVLVEKPLAADLAETERILATAERTGTPLACGFVERFNAVVGTAAQLLTTPPLHVLAVRHSPPTGRATNSVVHDLLIHDVDLTLRLVPQATVARVSAGRLTPPGSAWAEVADATVGLDSGAVATLSASRVGQRKVRTLTIAAADQLLELDLLRQDLTVYRHVRHSQLNEGTLTYRAETVIDIPFVRHSGEPLALQFEHFCDLVDGRADADAERATLFAPHEVAAQVAAA